MKELCPLCSNLLLRHLYQDRLAWFCTRCRQEMPNFNSNKFNSISEYCSPKRKYPSERLLFHVKSKKASSISTAPKSLNVLDSLVNQEKKKLAIIDFIQNNNELATLMKLSSEVQNTINTKYNKQNNKINYKLILNQSDYLKDSETIIFYICQAIFARDISLLDNQRLKAIKIKYYKNDKAAEQIVSLINLMKTLVLNFIDLISLDCTNNTSYSPKNNCLYLSSEIATYFDTVVFFLSPYGDKQKAIK